MHARYVWSTPPWVSPQGVSNTVRSQAGLIHTPVELHHWLIPQRAVFVPNYITNASWNLVPASNRAAHAMIDASFSVTGVEAYPLLVRPFLAMPGWARGAAITGAGINDVAEQAADPLLR